MPGRSLAGSIVTFSGIGAAILAVLDRIPLLRDLAHAFRGDRPSLIIEVRAARGTDTRPGLVVTVTNPGPSDLDLKAVGVVYSTFRPITIRVGVPLRVGEAPHVAWLGLAELSARSGRREPVSGIVSAFAETSVGTSRTRVDGEQLLAELKALYPPAP